MGTGPAASLKGMSPALAGALLVVAASSSALSACATYHDDLVRSQVAFEASELERALALLRGLEPDMSRLSGADRARYAYLRGMTDYRIGYRSEARHWLAVAASLEDKTPGSLLPDWEKRLTESLTELNEEVYSDGIASLSRPASSKAAEPSAPAEGEPTSPPADVEPPAGADPR